VAIGNFYSLALAAATVDNDVVYAASMAGRPQAHNMLALNANTGAILRSFAAGGPGDRRRLRHFSPGQQCTIGESQGRDFT
jgi:hypothetical protein